MSPNNVDPKSDRSSKSRRSEAELPTVAGEIGDAEDGNIRVRLIALENLVVALLAGASEDQKDLARDMAEYISPREGATPHRLTIEAAHNILALLERADRYKNEISGGLSS